MIFTKPLDRLVLEGRKTQTRRPTKATNSGGLIKPCFYRPGHNYAVQRHRGGFEIARIHITNVHREPLGDIDYPAARAEGFKTRAGFADHWMCIHDKRWPPTRPCPTCTTLDTDPDPACRDCAGTGVIPVDVDDDEILDRFTQRHADRIVWVITFALLDDTPRLLTPCTRPMGSELGYTSTASLALPEEPEAIDAATASRYATDADARARAHRSFQDQADINEAHDLEDRMRRLRLIAQRRGVNVQTDIRAIERRLAAIERKISTRNAA